MTQMIKALIFKEWIKIRALGLLPFVLLAAALFAYWNRLSGLIAMRGATVTWLTIIEKEVVFFDGLFWVFVAAGLFWGFLQSIPESGEGKARLALHLPCPSALSLSVPTVTGLLLIALLTLAARLGLGFIHETAGFPPELEAALHAVLFPWVLAAVVAWCAAASVTAEPSRVRAVLIALFAAFYLTMLSARAGFGSYDESYCFYAAAVLFWLPIPSACASRYLAGGPALSLARLSSVVVGLVALCWFMPFAISKMTAGAYFSMSGLWSPVSHEFVLREFRTSGSVAKTENGKSLTFREAREALPFYYRHDLDKWKRFPITIDGKAVQFADTAKSEFSRIRPIQLTQKMPTMTALIESRPRGSNFEMPDDIVVIGDKGLRFVNPETGRDKVGKTARFMTALSDAGVRFPLRKMAVNTSLTKPFDDGMWMVDSARQLIQLKMVEGEPEVSIQARDLPADVMLLTVDEDTARLYSGFVGTRNALYMNLYEGGLTKLPIEGLDLLKESVGIWSTPVSRTVILERDDRRDALDDMKLIVMTPDMKMIRSLTVSYPDEQKAAKEERRLISHFVSPVSIRQYESGEPGVLFRLRHARDWIPSLLGGLSAVFLFLLVQFFLTRRNANSLVKRRLPSATTVTGVCLSAIFGLPGALAVLAAWPIGSIGTNSAKRI